MPFLGVDPGLPLDRGDALDAERDRGGDLTSVEGREPEWPGKPVDGAEVHGIHGAQAIERAEFDRPAEGALVDGDHIHGVDVGTRRGGQFGRGSWVG